MITAYCSGSKPLELPDLSAIDRLPDDAVWIDMVDPSREEEANIERLLGLEVPTREDMKDI